MGELVGVGIFRLAVPASREPAAGPLALAAHLELAARRQIRRLYRLPAAASGADWFHRNLRIDQNHIGL